MNVNDKLLEAVKARQGKRTEFGHGIVTADRYVRTLQELAGLKACYDFGCRGNVSFNDAMEKAARTLVYGNKGMTVEEKLRDQYAKLAGEVELPKDTLMVFRHVLTTSQLDRDGDILHSDGMEVDPKMLLLWQHAHTMPIGKMLREVEHDNKRIVLDSCIVDINELCHDAAVMIDNGMGRFSHGFRALEFERMKDEDGSEGGFDVKRGEIMEQSLVSVAANVGAETEEVLLSLVEGGKLTSPMMRKVGKGIRERRAVSVPVKLDLKVTVNGREVKDEDKPGGGEGKGSRGDEEHASASKEADGAAEGEEEKAGHEEVKGIYAGDVAGSYEWVTEKLRQKCKRYLLSSGVSMGDSDRTYILATYADHVVMSLERSETSETIYYKALWKLEADEPEFQGEPKEITVEMTTEIREKMAEQKARFESAKPYPNEHACRLRSPGDFEPKSFRRTKRKHDGKEYSVIMGRLKGETTMTEQAYRYDKDAWDADDARLHCKGHDGKFEAAAKAGDRIRKNEILIVEAARSMAEGCPECGSKCMDSSFKCDSEGNSLSKIVFACSDCGWESGRIGEKRGRAISKTNEKKIRDAHDDVKEASGMEGVSRPCSALLGRAHGGLGQVLASLGEEEEPKRAALTVKEAMVHVLAEASPDEREEMVALLGILDEADKEDQRVKDYRALIGTKR